MQEWIVHYPRVLKCMAIACFVAGLAISGAAAQSQEPKPVSESAVSPSSDATPVPSTVPSGIEGHEWRSPTWGVQVAWSSDDWTVENEMLDSPYEGLQLGSEASTVFVEAYEGFNGSPQACLAQAEQEIAERSNTREVTRLSSRPLPGPISDTSESELFGVVADLPDGTIYRGAEYVSCYPLQPGLAVLELTWQTGTTSYNDELPGVNELFSSLILPDIENSQPG